MMWILKLLFLCLRSCADVSAPAVSLENPNGQHLVFLRLDIKAVLIGPFAYVENEMVFQNPEDRQIEGRFSFALPSGAGGPAMPSRFAMQIGETLMEGEVVNRSKAQKVFREILHERRDPALLEQDQEIQEFGFAAAVGSLDSSSPLAINCSLPHFGLVSGSKDNTSGLVNFEAQTSEPLVPDADALLEIQEPASRTATFSVDSHLVSLFVLGNETSEAIEPDFAPDKWIVYVDTSASTADSFLVRTPLIAALLDDMPMSNVQVFAFDIEVAELRSLGPKDDSLGEVVRQGLEARLPMGATDLELLLEHIQNHPVSPGESLGVLLLSDFIATVQERAAMKLSQILSSSPGKIVELGVIGTKFDSSTSSALAAAGDGRIVQIPLTSKNLPTVTSQVWSQLQRPLGARGTPMASSGWVWPYAAPDLHEGDELVIFSGGGTGLTLEAPKLSLGRGNDSVHLLPGSVQAAAPAFSALLKREADRAKLELLESERQLAKNKRDEQAAKEEIIALSESSRVMSPHTALLVLETEEDYVRFDIKRDQLSPILVVTDAGVELTKREDIILPPLPDAVPRDDIILHLENSSNRSNVSCDESTDCADDKHEDQQDEQMSSSLHQEARSENPSMAGGSTVNRPSWFLRLLLFLLLAFQVQGKELWKDLEQEASNTLQSYSSGPPTARVREEAVRYAAALWTKRRAEDLKSYCAQWMAWDPSNGLVYEYLARAAQHVGNVTSSLRAATSIIEIAPRDSEQLLRGAWLALALQTTPSAATWARRFAERALEERDDNPNAYRALALSAWMSGDFGIAASAYSSGVAFAFHERYGDVKRVLREEAALFLRLLRADSEQQALADELAKGVLKNVDADEGKGIGLRISLSWLTDGNDVDLHVVDPMGEECYFAHKKTSFGLELYSDQTQGLGPEVVVMKGRKAGTYKVGVKYFSSGAMGASRGTVIIQHIVDGIPLGEPQIEVFTLPSGYSDVLPITSFVVK